MFPVDCVPGQGPFLQQWEGPVNDPNQDPGFFNLPKKHSSADPCQPARIYPGAGDYYCSLHNLVQSRIRSSGLKKSLLHFAIIELIEVIGKAAQPGNDCK
jgi:hypothetical protein